MIDKNDYINLSQKELDDKFENGVESGNLALVKYLLTSPELKEHANIHADVQKGFKVACNNNKFDILRYFIFDMGIEKNKTIKTINSVVHNNKKHNIILVKNMFNLRELNGTLNKELKSNNSNNRKIKL